MKLHFFRQFKITLMLWGMAGIFISSVACAESIAVVVSDKSLIPALSKKEVIDIFMGRFDRLESGHLVSPVDYRNGTPLRASFYGRLVGKNEQQISAYWSRLLFSGRAKPPFIASSIEESAVKIDADPTVIAYLPISDITEEMKVVLVLE